MRKHTISFKHAFEGILYMVRTQPNFRFHLFAATAVSLASYMLGVSWRDWLILLFTIQLVIVAEMLNTAIEAITDLVTVKILPQAKIAKDVAAGMVLMSALLAIIVGLVILLPYLGRVN